MPASGSGPSDATPPRERRPARVPWREAPQQRAPSSFMGAARARGRMQGYVTGPTRLCLAEMKSSHARRSASLDASLAVAPNSRVSHGVGPSC